MEKDSTVSMNVSDLVADNRKDGSAAPVSTEYVSFCAEDL